MSSRESPAACTLSEKFHNLITLNFLCEETQNIYINSLPSLWDQRWEQERGERRQTQCRSENKDIEVPSFPNSVDEIMEL